MAIVKEIELNNGITLSYHRITVVENITNLSSIIKVKSYISKEHRIREVNNNGEDMFSPYTESKNYSLEYNKDLNIDTAYDYLKTLDEYSDCTDDLDDIYVQEESQNEE